jgi:hypothetical protein
MTAKLNKRERRAAALLAHYATCERLALALGAPAGTVDGKKISVALFKIERDAHNAATAQCNGEPYGGQPYREEEQWEMWKCRITGDVQRVFSGATIPGLYVNDDPRGYALKIDPDNAEGRALIESVRLHTDWGRNGILSPEITGD